MLLKEDVGPWRRSHGEVGSGRLDIHFVHMMCIYRDVHDIYVHIYISIYYELHILTWCMKTLFFSALVVLKHRFFFEQTGPPN